MGKRRGPGEGSIRQRPDGRWEARATLEVDGRTVRRSFFGETHREASEKLARAQVSSRAGMVVPGERLTVAASLAKLPKRPMLHSRVRAAYWAALGTATSPEEAEAGLRRLVGELSGDFPSAAACLADDLPALTVHLRYPARLRRRLRSTNLLERSLEKVRRRTKVIGRFPGETSCLTMAGAVMDLVIAGAHGLGLTLPNRHAIAALIAARSVPVTAEQIA
jgi:Transposase, Mutator family